MLSQMELYEKINLVTTQLAAKIQMCKR